MFIQCLTQPIRNLLERLGSQPFLQDFYMAGGTAAALHLGHRISVDIDLFTRRDFETAQILQSLRSIAEVEVVKEAGGTLIVNLEGVKVAFFLYDYPLIEPFQEYLGIRVAGPIDIGLMKITAISQRGSRRDFIDLYFICRKVKPLPDLLFLMEQKYSGVNYSVPHLLRSLVYFHDAEKEPMPRLLQPLPWPNVKRYFENQAKKLAGHMFW